MVTHDDVRAVLVRRVRLTDQVDSDDVSEVA